MTRRGRHPIARALVLCVSGLVLHASSARAQGGAPPQAPARPAPASPAAASRWEIEGYGGLVLGGLAPFGSHALPAPGAALATSSVLFPTRQTPSWFFGDGATLVNDVNAEFGLAARITPLDTALTSLGFGVTGGGGVRVRRTLTPRVSAELGVDVSRSAGGAAAKLRSAAEATRASFESAFSALLATGPFPGVVVNATSAHTDGAGLETTATFALTVNFRKRAGFVPYATLGGGVMAGSGALPSLTLDGDYRFTVLSSVPIHEHDHLTMRYARSSHAAPVGVIGAGLRRDVSSRWGWRADGRLLVGGHGTRLLLDATPTISTGSPAGFVESFTNPNIQFSNDASTGRRSTLGGPLVGFVAFDEGVRTRVIVSVGVFRRF